MLRSCHMERLVVALRGRSLGFRESAEIQLATRGAVPDSNVAATARCEALWMRQLHCGSSCAQLENANYHPACVVVRVQERENHQPNSVR